MYSFRFNLVVFAVLSFIVLAGCESTVGGFDRHRMSRLYSATDDSGEFVFEASASSAMPPDDAQAEAGRLAWLDEWMALGRLCPQGYRVVERRPIRPGDSNTYGHHLRYRVACTKPTENEG